MQTKMPGAINFFCFTSPARDHAFGKLIKIDASGSPVALLPSFTVPSRGDSDDRRKFSLADP
jgi:hypothetical protein